MPSEFPIQAIHDNVIIDIENPLYDGLVALPDTKTEPPCIGRVMSVGTGAKCAKCKTRVPFDVKPGDRVAYNRYGQHNEIRVGGKLYKSLKREEILAVLPDEPKPVTPKWGTADYGALNE